MKLKHLLFMAAIAAVGCEVRTIPGDPFFDPQHAKSDAGTDPRDKPVVLNPEVDAVAILPDGTVMSQDDLLKMIGDAKKMSDKQLKALNKRLKGTQIRNWKATFSGMEKHKP